ncbi:MAG: hypothetical protein JWQ35_2356 [Bacteriovoracaceae bacterium]|nr:hypothetical protein [Bacteriovoracaceae bacterium]
MAKTTGFDKSKPRAVCRAAIEQSVPPDLWAKNVAYVDELKALIATHRMSRHPVKGVLNTEKLNPEVTKAIHLEFAHGFAQIFTDSLIHAMAQSADLEPRLGPAGKVTSRFLLQLNLLDELGFFPNDEVTGDYWGTPFLAHYIQFVKTLESLGSSASEILNYKPSPASKAARKTFTDHYNDYVLLTAVLACAETVFTLYAGPWAKSVSLSTDIDTSEGYHAIHVDDEHGESIDDDHSEDSWYIFRQAIVPERYDEVKKRVTIWLDLWNDFADNTMHLARTLKKK